MIKEIIDCFLKWALKHKDVHTFKYLDEMLINSQPNNKPYSVIIETDGYFLSVRDNHTLSINMDILGFVDVDEVTTLDIACLIGLSLINKVVDENRNLLALRDYSILLFTKKTGDRCSGARFTINFVVPSFIDWCTELDNWDELYIIIEYTMKNYGLRNSDVAKDARVLFNDTLFSLVFPDYITYINSGRKPNSKMPPTEAIVEWCRSKGIPTDNNTVWKIRQGIARQGIAARPVIDSIMELALNEWDRDWSLKVFNEIISELINWFLK